MKKRSYFQVFFLNFILMMIIPLLTILLIFWKADRIVSDQILDYASGTMERYSELFDVAIKDMSNTCLSIFGSNEFRAYYNYSAEGSDEKYIKSYEINDLLESVNSEKYYDVFVYFSTDDKVISATKTSLKSQRYYEVYYGGDMEDYWQEFQSVIDCDSRKPALYVLNSQDKMPYLCVAMNAQGTMGMDYTICVVLDPAYVREIYNIRDADENSSFLILNEEKQILIASNAEAGNWDIWRELLQEDLGNDIWYSKDDHMLKVRESQSIPGTYVHVVLAESFWSVLSELRVFSMLGIVLCVLTSIVMAYRNTIRSYRPVDDLVSRLTSRNDLRYDKGSGNEFDFVTAFLDENDKRIRESKSVHKEWRILKLLKGTSGTLNEKTLEQNGISFVSDRFLVCILKVFFPQEKIDDLQSFIIQNVFEELGDRNGRGYLVMIEEDEFALLVNMTGDIQALVDDLQYGQKFCEQNFHFLITLGYSQIHENIRNIPKCYREAQETIRYLYLFGQGSVISFSQIADRKKQQEPPITEARTLPILKKYIGGENNQKNVARFVEEFLQIHNISEASSMDRVELFKQEVADALNRIMEKRGDDEENSNDLVAGLLGQPTLIGFQTYLAYLLQEIQKKGMSEGDEALAVKTKAYIDENYWNAGLSVVMLGEQMGTRGRYLSKVFKEKYQISLPDYLLNVRIQQAKRYLVEKNMTIQEVAEATGFLSIQVFGRNFKEKEGVTPGRYKELMQKTVI